MAEAVAVDVAEGEGVAEGMADAVPEGVGEKVAEGSPVALGEGVMVRVAVVVAVGVSDWLAEVGTTIFTQNDWSASGPMPK